MLFVYEIHDTVKNNHCPFLSIQLQWWDMAQKTKMLYWSWPTTMVLQNMIKEMLMHRYLFFHWPELSHAVSRNNTKQFSISMCLLQSCYAYWVWLFSFQIAISTDDVYKTAEVVRLNGGHITREPGALPGINTKITACTDPDGWKTVSANLSFHAQHLFHSLILVPRGITITKKKRREYLNRWRFGILYGCT
jgi:hypothetical protein